MMPRHSVLYATMFLASLCPLSGRGADPPKQEDDAGLDQARQQYDRARDLAIHGRLEESRKLMEDTWSLKHHWQIACYLGYTELQTGRYRSAAEHTSYGLRLWPRDSDPTQRQSVERVLTDAKTHVAAITLRGLASDSVVTVDGTPRDSLFLLDPVFVDPGSHSIEVRRPNGTGRKRSVTASAGAALELDMTPDPVATSPASAPVAVAQPSAVASSTYEPPTSGWSPRTWTLVGEGTLAAVALGVGIGFGLHANSLGDDAKTTMASLKSTSSAPCEGSTNPQCRSVADTYEDRKTSAGWANVALVTSGVLGIATVATLLLWPQSTAHPRTGRQYWISPAAGNSTGLTIGGAF